MLSRNTALHGLPPALVMTLILCAPLPQLSNYNPTCHPGVGWSLSCPLAGWFGETSDQYKWLKKDLAAVDHSVTP